MMIVEDVVQKQDKHKKKEECRKAIDAMRWCNKKDIVALKHCIECRCSDLLFEENFGGYYCRNYNNIEIGVIG